MINKENIEAFLLDYIEGNLSENLKIELFEFLDENPEYKEYLDELPELVAPEITLENKVELKKSLEGKPEVFEQLQENNLELWSVASMEDELNPQEKLLFDRIKSESNSIHKLAQQFAATKLIPEKDLVFQQKKELYRKPIYVSFIRWSSIGVAASLALFILWQQSNSNNQPTLSAGKKKGKTEISPSKSRIKDDSKNTINIPSVNENEVVESWNELAIKTKESPIEEKNNPLSEKSELAIEKVNNQDTVINSLQSLGSEGVELAILSNPSLNNENPLNAKVEDKALTVTEFVSGKINNRIYGKPNPSREEKYMSFGDKLANASGGRIQMGYDARSNKRLFRFKLGIFSIEKKKSVKAVTNK